MMRSLPAALILVASLFTVDASQIPRYGKGESDGIINYELDSGNVNKIAEARKSLLVDNKTRFLEGEGHLENGTVIVIEDGINIIVIDGNQTAVSDNQDDEGHNDDGNQTSFEGEGHENDANNTDHEEDGHDDHEEDGHDDHEEDGHDDHEEDGHDDHEDSLSDTALEASSSSQGEKPWAAALLAAFLVNLCTLTGIIVLIPASYLGRRASEQTKDYVLQIVIPSFACGALLATAVFLLIPESLTLLSGGHAGHSDGAASDDEHGHRLLEGEEDDTESDAAWKFGVSALGGYFLPFLFAAFFPHGGHHVPEEILDNNETLSQDTAQVNTKRLSKDLESSDYDDLEVNADDPNGVKAENSVMIEAQATEVEGEVQESDEATSDFAVQRNNSFLGKDGASIDYRLAASVLAGDFFHNFADGIFIGTSFLLCGRDIAVVVTATTIFHELCQELADFFLLTNQCRIPVWKALMVNFLSGFSVLLGVIVIFAMEVSRESIGIILGMSAGVYFYVALTETAPRINEFITNLRERGICFLFWVLGAIPIGLVLLNHHHCD